MPQEQQCRICLAGNEENEELGRLIKPCLCKGSMRYVHISCLNTWRTTSESRSAFWACPQCGFKYAFARTRVQGLASSRIILGMTSLTLFTFLVFLSSYLVSFMLPELDPSTLSSINYPTLVAQSTTEYSYTYSSFHSPWAVAGDMIRLVVGAFAEAENAWKPKEGDVPVAIKNSESGPFKATIRRAPRRRPKPSWLIWFIRRYVIGTAFIGSISFLNLFAFGPIPFMRGRFGRGRRDGGADIGTILVVMFVIIGVGRALYQVYTFTQKMAQKLLTKAETAILEVGGDEEDEVAEESTMPTPTREREEVKQESSSGEEWQHIEGGGSNSQSSNTRQSPSTSQVQKLQPEWELPPSPGGWNW